MKKIKKQKTQSSFIKWKLKFKDYKNCLVAAQLGNIINHLQNIQNTTNI